MALSRVQYEQTVANTTTFYITFPYLSKDDILAYVDGVAVEYTWLTAYSIKIDPAPDVGAIIDIHRETSRDEPLVDFQDASTLTEYELDLATRQSFYIVQEMLDIVTSNLSVAEDGSYSANNRRISQVAEPDSDDDVATAGWVAEQFTAGVDAAQAAEEATSAAAQAVAAAENAAAAVNNALAAYEAQLANKLDASTFNPTTIREYLKLADGAGSGLDADRLDGLEATYFYSPSNPPPTVAPTTSQVQNALVGTLAGGIGTYAMFKYTGSSLSFGDVVNGANLAPASAAGTTSGTAAGTWRCLGSTTIGGTDAEATTLFMRIA